MLLITHTHTHTLHRHTHGCERDPQRLWPALGEPGGKHPPYLQLDFLAVQVDGLNLEIYTCTTKRTDVRTDRQAATVPLAVYGRPRVRGRWSV